MEKEAERIKGFAKGKFSGLQCGRERLVGFIFVCRWTSITCAPVTVNPSRRCQSINTKNGIKSVLVYKLLNVNLARK